MINRRSFIQLVRNRIAAGVLCSGMLTDALEGEVVKEYLFPAADNIILPKIGYINSTFSLGFKVSKELMEDDLYGVGIAQQMDNFSKEVAERARQRMENELDEELDWNFNES